MKTPSRRDFIRAGALAAAGTAASSCSLQSQSAAPKFEGVIDIHQHAGYHGRFDPVMISHQETMGIAKTVLLPSASAVARPSTHDGRSNGLAARAHGNPACKRLTDAHPDKFVYFANEVPDLETAQVELEKYLKAGAIGIGEQKFNVECDGPHMRKIYDIAKDYGVPVLLHFQHKTYNLGFERFHKILEAYPTVNFFGHAQTWWANIDKNHDPEVEGIYPKGPVTAGGITDRYLTDYPNIFGDLSAGSGLNAMTRDLEHAKEFLHRHQDQLCYASDCADTEGQGDGCSGAKQLAVVRDLVTDEAVLNKILALNARRILKI